MPELQKTSGVLTIGEAFERLKKNPDDPDPELQRFKKSSEEFAKRFTLSQTEIARIIEHANSANRMLQSTIDAMSVSKNLLGPTLETIQASSGMIRSAYIRITATVRKNKNRGKQVSQSVWCRAY